MIVFLKMLSVDKYELSRALTKPHKKGFYSVKFGQEWISCVNGKRI